VFSTLHTNDSIAAFTRLIDMGVEPFLVASSVRAVEAQRLVRRLCPDCSQPTTLPHGSHDMIEALRARYPQLLATEPNWRTAHGCPTCHQSGYRGRLGIYEFVEVSPELQSAIMQRLPSHELTAIARSEGYRNLREDGMIKAWRGETSLDEVLRVTGSSNAEDA
ncbi:MAG TPA: ATPase, T2SS/T4P/T4SS family, partial [Burkholderiaceae bacterium]|nr:ATPase, T2SS/T4P/T4SS family [Burkholderiaceae bacterium]